MAQEDVFKKLVSHCRCVDRRIVTTAGLSFHKSLYDNLIMPFSGPVLA